jgi:hypothetical protein
MQPAQSTAGMTLLITAGALWTCVYATAMLLTINVK